MTRMLPPILTETQIVEITGALADTGLHILENALPSEYVARWRARAFTLQQEGALKPAGVGRAENREIALQVRSDTIAWLEAESENVEDRSALGFIEALRRALNERLYLGVDHAECHFALYPPSGHYSKHLDRHRNTDARVISFVLYLNESWHAKWGGQLKIFDNKDNLLRVVEPCGGTLVLFRSEQFPHEVVASAQNRVSLTGWLRRRT